MRLPRHLGSGSVRLLVVARLMLVGVGAWAEEAGPSRDVVSGTLVDERGQPVAGAELRGVGWRRFRPSTSAADGSFRLEAEDEAEGRAITTIIARASDGRLGVLGVFQQKLEPVRVVVKAPKSLEVVVKDGEARPVAGAEVGYLREGAVAVVAGGVTDAEGRWVGVVPEGSGWAVFARKSGVGFDYRMDRKSAGNPVPKPPPRLNLALDGAISARVKVVDREGRPLAGARVGPWHIQKQGQGQNINLSGLSWTGTETGADGVAVLDWLPAHFTQGLPILAHKTGFYAPESQVGLENGTPVKEVVLILFPEERIRGRVTHADGRPASGLRVIAQGQGAYLNSSHAFAKTDGDGRYTLKAASEQAFLVSVVDGDRAAPYQGPVLVRVGKPVDGLDFVVGRSTKLRGRVTIGPDDRPGSNQSINVVVDKGSIPDELNRPGDHDYHGVRLDLWAPTDDDGRYEITLGPGEYRLSGPPRVEPVTLTIPVQDPPAEIVQDFRMPRPVSGPLVVKVVDGDGRPVAGAVVNAAYASGLARGWFRESKTQDDGLVRTERSLDPMVLHARTADGSQAGLSRSESEAAEAQVVVKPVATASGRLTDPGGKPLANTAMTYGIRVYMGEPGTSPFSEQFGGKLSTDAEGRFVMNGLVPGEAYELELPIADSSFRTAADVTAKGPGPLDLGTLAVDPNPTKPYVPPTPAEQTTSAFATNADRPIAERIKTLLLEGRRERTRPMLLLGRPNDPASIDLFRLFDERVEALAGKPPTPASLRWDFELASLDVDRPEVRELAGRLGMAGDAPPTLVVLGDDGSTALATFALITGSDGKLDSELLSGFLATWKLPTLDAEALLSEAMARARAGDKRVFLDFSASWCGPCRRLSRFLVAHEAELAPHFEFAKIDISRDTHAEELRERYKGSVSGGVPWFAILDTEGHVLTTSDRPDRRAKGRSSNIGFPSDPSSIDHFVGMLRETASRLSGETLDALRADLLKE